jgi:hypothetical protein
MVFLAKWTGLSLVIFSTINHRKENVIVYYFGLVVTIDIWGV